MIPAERATQDSLCQRLRRERERRHIALSSISANTKISASLFEALERGDVSRWPAGIYRRAFVRAYAQAIGLDPDEIAREFAQHFPDPAEPPAVESTPAPCLATAAARPAEKAGLRLTLTDSPTTFVHGRLLDGLRQRLAAVACDAAVVSAITLGMFLVFDRFWLPLGVAMIGYYLGGILLLGNAPGVCLLAPEAGGEPHYNRSPDDPSHAGADRDPHSPWHLGVPAR